VNMNNEPIPHSAKITPASQYCSYPPAKKAKMLVTRKAITTTAM